MKWRSNGLSFSGSLVLLEDLVSSVAHMPTFLLSEKVVTFQFISCLYMGLTVLPINGVCFHKYFFNLELYSQHIETAL